jgi:hypothetical protein
MTRAHVEHTLWAASAIIETYISNYQLYLSHNVMMHKYIREGE